MLSAHCAALNRDDPSFEYFSSQVGRLTKIIPFTKWPDSRRSLALAGDYNRYNIAAAAAVAKVLKAEKGVPLVAQSFSGVPGRMEEIYLGQNFRAIVDFAHTPAALEQVLSTLKCSGKLILVFGCAMSIREDDRFKAIQLAVKLARKGDIVVLTGKGHEKSMCFGKTEYPWSDRDALEKAIKMLK